MDLIGADESAAQVTDKIKDLLYTKSGEKVDAFRPHVANSLFNDLDNESDESSEADESDEYDETSEEESEE